MSVAKWHELTPARRQLLKAALVAALMVAGAIAYHFARSGESFDKLRDGDTGPQLKRR